MSDFALRWGRLNRYEELAAKWHHSGGDDFTTLCGRKVRLAIRNGTFGPELEDVEKVNCAQCRRILDIRHQIPLE